MGWIADLLKEIPTAARYKFELEAMEKKNVVLESENTVLKSQVSDLRQEIQRRDDVIEEEKSHGQHLAEVREKILILLAEQPNITDDRMPQALGINHSQMLFHLEEIKNLHLIKPLINLQGHRSTIRLPSWAITQTGREYLDKHGLLK